MKKLILVLFLLLLSVANACFADDNYGLRDYSGIELPKGSFIQVISAQEISTLYCDIGSKIEFISTADLYLQDTNILPRETKFYGYVEKINEPVIGTNASMVIKITKAMLSDGFEMPVKGHIYTPNRNLIGGELTEPASYDKKSSYRQGFSTSTGLVPGATRKPGEHTIIASGANLLIVLEGPLFITHTVTN